jgi:trimeric autotransporter adhesin
MDPFEWPNELLGRFLHFLALDGASATMQRLAYITSNNSDLRHLFAKIEKPMVMRIQFDEQDKNNNFMIPFYQSSIAKIEIHWGDGCIDTAHDVGHALHRYELAGEYTVRVFRLEPDSGAPALDHIGFGFSDIPKGTIDWGKPLKSIESLGHLGIQSLNALFYETPSFDGDVSRIRTGEITSMEAMFFRASNFNSPIGDWDVSNVTTMGYMFSTCDLFNQPIESWDVSKVRSMYAMFEHARSFNQSLEQWKVKDDVMTTFMFNGAVSIERHPSWYLEN